MTLSDALDDLFDLVKQPRRELEDYNDVPRIETLVEIQVAARRTIRSVGDRYGLPDWDAETMQRILYDPAI
jgi:hypothetical protein